MQLLSDDRKPSPHDHAGVRFNDTGKDTVFTADLAERDNLDPAIDG